MNVRSVTPHKIQGSGHVVDGKSFPTLYKKATGGKIMYWYISTLPDPDHSTGYRIYTYYGQIDGKEQSTVDFIYEGKNIGKANETTPEQQAALEAQSRWTKQIERKGYVTNKDDLGKDLRPGAEPMLAHRYDKSPEKINFPCYIQPKLDGHRCIAVFTHDLTGDGTCKVELYSRQRSLITGVPHINEAVKNMINKAFKGAVSRIILDGELYNHDYKSKFEELTGFIRSEEPKAGYEAVQYHIYDIVDLKRDQQERLSAVNVIFKMGNESEYLKQVYSPTVENDDQLMSVFRGFREAGYEGAILRNTEAMYVGTRSYDLQKVKEFDDAEYKITGVEEGRGKMKGHAIFVCETSEGKEFRAKMKGSMELLADIFRNKETYYGCLLTVMYQGLTSDNIPRFPVGLRLREDI